MNELYKGENIFRLSYREEIDRVKEKEAKSYSNKSLLKD